MVSVIIPAFNEENTIDGVIVAALKSPLVGEVIVISDGSTDRTAEIAEKHGVRVIRLLQNHGKGFAMEQGARAARFPVLFFSDADIGGLTPELVRQLVQPVLRGECEMFVGIRDRKFFVLNQIVRISPILGGERVLTKKLWDAVPDRYKEFFKIEIALNYFCKRLGKKMQFAVLPGLLHLLKKEKKFGFVDGFRRRLLMYWQVLTVSLELYAGRTFVDFVKKVLRVVFEK